MKRILFAFFLFANLALFGQGSTNFTISLTEISVPSAPGVQSFAWGQANGKWLIIGGRRDGLHQRQPFAAFLAADNNTSVFVIDPISKQVWSQNLSALSVSMQEQLQSTNPNFYQRGNTLYIIGGYGWSDTQQDHYTYPNLTAVDVSGAINAIVNGSNMAPFFSQMTDNRLQVTGGQLGMLNDTFYLVGGQNFIGAYNPMGPTHGPGFFQEYSNEIRMFTINGSGSTLSIGNYNAIRDTQDLHRRDYNMMPQLFPDGTRGFTVFSGVFQYGVDLPYLNCVNIKNGSYQVIPNFEQLLSQYHSAKLGIWDSTQNMFHNYFFGGIARFYIDNQGLLVDDQDVPFVKTISRITRFANDSVVEYDTGDQMPGFLGSGAEFIPLESAPFAFDDVLDLDALPNGRHLIGHIYGGIESSQNNIFFVNNGSQSNASNRVFEVYIDLGPLHAGRPKNSDAIKFEISPNPTAGKILIQTWVAEAGEYKIVINDIQGKLLTEIPTKLVAGARNVNELSLDSLSSGVYFITISNGNVKETQRLELNH